jgi:hypothetical protein
MNRLSPIQHLYKHLIPALGNIALEKAKELQGLLDEHKITFVFDEQSKEMVFFANHADNSITIGLYALERLWARAYAYISLYEFMTKKLLQDPTVTNFDLNDPAVRPGMDLLRWAVDVEARLRRPDPGDVCWPGGLPRPVPDAAKNSLENAADELFLCAIASILHHEVGHIRLKHDPRTLPKPTVGVKPEDDAKVKEADAILLGWEKEADAWSRDWLLEGLDQEDERFLKRVLGTALGYLWLASRNVYTGQWLRRHHPPAWDRIYHNIKQHIPDNPGHPIWLFVAYVLQLHLFSLSKHPKLAECENPEEWVNRLLDHVAKTKE